MRELKKYKLHWKKLPKEHESLSGVAHVCDARGRRPSNFGFDESFADAVGRAMPRGISQQDPAYIKALYMPGRNVWRVFAMYMREEVGVLLWETPDLPRWLR